MVVFEAPLTSLTFYEVLAFHQIPHLLSKTPLVKEGLCDEGVEGLWAGIHNKEGKKG